MRAKIIYTALVFGNFRQLHANAGCLCPEVGGDPVEGSRPCRAEQHEHQTIGLGRQQFRTSSGSHGQPRSAADPGDEMPTPGLISARGGLPHAFHSVGRAKDDQRRCGSPMKVGES